MVDVDLCNNDNQTPISLAAQFGHHEVVGELLAHGANAGIRNSQLESPLDLACLNGRLETVDLLLKSSSAQFPAQLELQRSQSSLFLQNPSQHQSAATTTAAASTHQHSPKSISGAQSSQLQRRPSASGTWSSLLLRTKSFSRDVDQDADQQQEPSSASRRRATLTTVDVIEKLLDHSPLHYAVRRGHLDIIRLLLYRYNANLLQITTRGSVLHETATNGFSGGGKHAEVLALIFDYVRNTVAKENRSSYLDRLLNLKNAQMKNVFQLLNEINNRSAHEIKRLIYELNERLTNLEDSTSQKQQQRPASKLTRQFSDSQQINSFLTLRRGMTTAAANYSNQHQQPLGPIINGTQTIDRSYQPKHRLEQSQQSQQQQQQQRALMIQRQQQFQVATYQPTMTRSVSNLTHVPTSQQSQNSQQQHFAAGHQNRRSKSRDFGSLLMEAKQMGNVNSCYPQTGPTKAQMVQQLQQEQQQQHQQQQQHLVRSQTDCSYLNNGGNLGMQDQSIDRQSINRHYHVYDFEFYPPRLQPQQQQAQQQKHPPAVPSRPNHPDGLVGPNSVLRSSTRSTVSSRVQQARANFDGQQMISLDNNRDSRLSLNVDLGQQPQQHQMDRFLGRHSKKVGVVAPNSDPNQRRREEQKQICPTQDPRLSMQQQRQKQVPSSCSLESHLSEPHLFDTTRQAIMRDFDEMIGRELLNRDFSQIIRDQTQPNSGSRSSMLTGVMLDMDKFGERLTVSGTLTGSSSNNEPADPLSSSSLTPEPAKRAATFRQSVIYDLPSRAQLQSMCSASDNESSSPSNREAQHGQRAANYRLAGRSQTTAPDQTSVQVAMTASRPAFTEPPKVKPPPPPPPQLMAPGSAGVSLASPLRVTAPTGLDFQPSSGDQLGLLKMASITSNSSSSSGSSSSIMRIALNRSAKGGHGQASHVISDPDSGVCTSNSPASLSHESETATQSAAEVTFSSLPANPQLDEQPTLVQQKPRRPRPPIDASRSASASTAIVRHRNKKSPPPPPNELQLPAAKDAQIVGPPSPTTAQMCIEQALGTIERNTHEMANQTSSVVADYCNDDHDKDLGYENCLDLQRKLRQVDCRSLRELLSEAIDEEEEGEDDDDDDDYAESVIESQTSSGRLSQSSSNTTDREAAKDQEPPVEDQSPTGAANDNRREVLLRVVVDDDANKPDKNVTSGDDLEAGDEQNVFYINPIDLKNIVEQKRAENENSRSMTNTASLTDEDLCASVDKSSGMIRFTLKKRRMRSEDESCQSLGGSTSNSSLHDAATNHQDTSIKKTKFNEDQESAQAPPHPQQQQQQPDSPDASRRSKSKSIQQLGHWFEKHLVGLTDYVDKFTQNGFDQVHFLNHPSLINDETLRLIGIEEESHRLLIVERIASEMPLVDFEPILREMRVSQCPSRVQKLGELLELDPNQLSSCSKDSCDEENDLLRNAAQKLPIGHRVRLLSVLDLLGAGRENRLKLCWQQSSTDSGEIEMDTSQISATSSSSKESIKSIVSKPPLPPPSEIEIRGEPEAPAEQSDPQSAAAKEAAEAPARPEKQPEQQIEMKQIAPAANQDENVRPKMTTKVWSSNRTSLVSEAARKLEMAAAASQASQFRPPQRPQAPVAAVRKSTVRSAASNQQQQQQEAGPGTVAKKEEKGVLPPVKSICWPPKTTNHDDETEQASTNCAQSVGSTGMDSVAADSKPTTKTNTVVSNRLSYQRMLFEEKSRAASAAASSIKTKPAPPAKPAKLSSKFATDLNNRL